MNITATAQTNKELERRLNILAVEISQMKETKTGFGNTRIGGYGEFTYTNIRHEDETGKTVANGTNPEADAQRFILYIAHDFSPKWKLSSEIEIEHVNQIFLEQATIDYIHSDAINFQVGLMLIPVGIVNLYHEPTSFLTVERPEIESKIIPSTWRENGISFFGKNHKLNYRLSLVGGILASGFSSDGVRGGRQKGAQAEARDLAWVGRLDYQIVSNAVLGASAYIGKAGGTNTDVSHKIYELHFDGTFAGFHTRVFYTISSLGNTTQLNNELGKTGSAAVGKKMTGYYAELGYNVLRNITDWSLLPFVRYEKYNTQDEVEATFTKDKSKDRTNTILGINAKPIESIVFKFDYTMAKNKAKTGQDAWRLGFGWNF